MEDLGPGFSVPANRRRLLKAASLSSGCMVGIWLVSVQFFAAPTDWPTRIGDLFMMAPLLFSGWMFSLVAYVRLLDWTRGRTKLKGSV